MNYMRYTIFLFFVLVNCMGWQKMGMAQTTPVGQMDDTLRNLQLMGRLDANYSFTIRPFYNRPQVSDTTKKAVFQFVKLPAIATIKFNSHHPYGWNDEGMLAAKGLQTELTAGVYARYGPVSVQLQPQFVYAANPDFEYSSAYGAPTTGAYARLLPGQSSIRVHAGPVSLGLSSENLWWGPGQYSSLLLSNNAPGFPHITLNTTRPLVTAIGSFEFQLISGKLYEDSAKGGLYENFHLKSPNLTDDWRYLNAIIVTYQPRFIKGLYFGATRAFQIYSKDIDQPELSLINKYIPVLSALFKNDAGGSDEDARKRDQQLSLFARMLLPKSNVEFYFEYGWNDHKANSRDFFLDPVHAAAYIVGGKKLFYLPKNSWLELNGELTHMSQTSDYLVRNSGNWYVHSPIVQGMTNQRQILGAGSGFGNNVQTISLSWIRNIRKLGITVQRIQHDPMRIVAGINSNLGLTDVAWNELAFGVQGRWDFGKILAQADVHYAGSKNYAWQKDRNVGNLFMQLRLMMPMDSK
jgi:hypothetical protein